MSTKDKEIQIIPKEYNDILNIQYEVLNMIARQYKVKDTLAKLCVLAETLLPNSIASVMLLNSQTNLLNVKSAPSVPQIAQNALTNLKPGPKGGSCGNAVYKNEAQYVINTFEDERWEDLRQIAYDFNLCSCWSMPVKNEGNEAIGSFALSSFEHREPSPFHKKLLEVASSIVSIVLKNQEKEQKLELTSEAIENALDGMLITDADTNIIEINKSFRETYGYELEEIKGKNPNILASGYHNKKFYSNIWKTLKEDGKWSGEIINRSKSGDIITQWVSISAQKDEENKIKNYLAMFTDLTKLKEAQEKSEYLAFHDHLTGLYNKSYFEKNMNSKEEKTLILLNIDNFSYINTAYGFDVGDKLLKELSKKLSQNFEIDKLFRFNSDEFALMFKDDIDIKVKISEIQKFFFNRSIDIENMKLNVSFSFGAVRAKDKILRKAASALKKAKDLGKNRYFIFEKEDDVDYTHIEEFIEATSLIRNAIENDKIIPFFQGIYNNKTKRIDKYEALVRIEDKDKVIPPYIFLEPARLSGLMTDITKIVIEKTFEKMSNFSYCFSINITEDDLTQNYLAEFIEEKLKKHNINANRVTLEILEGVSSSGKKNHICQLSKLKEMGLKIAIDDFGAEYSNFERIIDLDVDFIKIDAKYIKNIQKDKKSYEITKALSFFAKNSNIACIAEFVHCEEVQEIIDELGIDYSQGYYFSEPTKDIN